MQLRVVSISRFESVRGEVSIGIIFEIVYEARGIEQLSAYAKPLETTFAGRLAEARAARFKLGQVYDLIEFHAVSVDTKPESEG